MLFNEVVARQTGHAKSRHPTKQFACATVEMVIGAITKRNVIAAPNANIVLCEELFDEHSVTPRLIGSFLGLPCDVDSCFHGLFHSVGLSNMPGNKASSTYLTILRYSFFMVYSHYSSTFSQDDKPKPLALGLNSLDHVVADSSVDKITLAAAGNGRLAVSLVDKGEINKVWLTPTLTAHKEGSVVVWCGDHVVQGRQDEQSQFV